WESAEVVLDEAMADLGEQTRGLLVLKFFEGKTAREVGQRLGISEEAARKRVSRAVDELRTVFARRGGVMSAGALGHSLATQAPPHHQPRRGQAESQRTNRDRHRPRPRR